MDKMQTMRGEFDAATKFSRAVNEINQTPIVDDDYPEVRERYEGALIGLLRAMKANNRFDAGNNHYGVTA